MDGIKLLITLNKDGVKENISLSITREKSIEIRKVMAEGNEEKITDFFRSITDISGVEYNIDFDKVEGIELGV